MNNMDIPELNPKPPKNNFFLRLLQLIGGLAGALVIPFVCYIAWHSQQNFYEKIDKSRWEIETHRRYTIGMTTTAKNVRNHNSEETFIDYNYTIRGQKLYDNFQAHTIFKVPKRYYIIYSTEDSTHNRILPIEVPDTITNAPVDGWKVIPGTRYTIGKIEKTEKYKASVSFSANNVNYKVFVFEDFLAKTAIGRKYYISFSSSNPEYGLSICATSESDSAKSGTPTPSDGWITLPGK
jgi:hypothetical protein